jgi:hypothetical protein
MKKCEEQETPSSCWNRAKPEEMVFVLLERDPSFAEAIRAWAADRIRRRRNKPADDKIQEALLVAEHVESLHRLGQAHTGD